MVKVLVALFVVLLGSRAEASKPIPWTMKGCVTGGQFYSIDKDRGASLVRTMKPLDISKLDGKFIEVAGLLHPGDYFTPGDAPPVTTRDCSKDDRLAIEYAKAAGLRMQAARLPEDKLDDKLALVEASLKLVSPADCDTYIDRAHYLAKKKDLASTARDLTILEGKKCRFRGKLNWLLLQELGKTLGNDKAAVRALTLALANCDGDICKPGIEKDLAAAKAAAKK